MTTAAPGPRPKLIIAAGAPDGMTSAQATELYARGRLPGISGITRALMPWLRERKQAYSVVMFGTSNPVSDASAQRLLAQTKGHVLVNVICEPVVQRGALHQVARFELATGVPMINPSWAVGATTRPLIARRLAHQAGVRVPQCTLYGGGALTLAEHIEANGHTYPVLLRPPGLHGSEGLVRVDGPDELERKGTLRSYTVTDFVDFRSEDGLWRKYRMVYAGDRLFRRHVLTDAEWNLTRDARRFMRARPELMAEEREWLERPVTLEPGSIEARAMHQFRALQLDFGVIDCALPPSGDLVVFEINACVQLTNVVDQEAAADPRHHEANTDEILDTLLQAIHARAAPR